MHTTSEENDRVSIAPRPSNQDLNRTQSLLRDEFLYLLKEAERDGIKFLDGEHAAGNDNYSAHERDIVCGALADELL